MTLQQRVDRSLDAACSNGYETFVKKAPLDQVVADLRQHDADLEDENSEELAACVIDWRGRRDSW